MAFWGEDSDAKTASIISGAFIVVTAIVCFTAVVLD